MARRRLWLAVAVAAPCLAFAGCGGSGGDASGALPAPTSSSSHSYTSGAITGPSESARMTCAEDEIANAVTLTLGLSGQPKKSSEWVKPVYTCTYQLSEGPLRLAVTELGSDAAAQKEFDRVRGQYVADKTPIQTLENFDVPAFLASDDVVVSVKDDKLLRVDASSLPAKVGPDHRTRRDLSYIVASSVLRCWTGA